MAVLIWALDASLKSPESFASLLECLASPLMKFVIWSIMAALIYHSVAGIKHLIMDVGIGESFEAGTLAARLVVIISLVLSVLAGAWIW